MTKLSLSILSLVIFGIAEYCLAENIIDPKSNTRKLIDAALAQTATVVTYNGTYFKIAYPMGDVPAEFGVCTDVIIRAYRKLGIDLQQFVHEDMRSTFCFTLQDAIGIKPKPIPILIIAACPTCKLSLRDMAKN